MSLGVAKHMERMIVGNTSIPALEGVPVWTVTNEQDEFVLVSQGFENGPRLGLFYLSQSDAQLMAERVKCKEFGIVGAKVALVTLDKVFEFLTTENLGSVGIAIRLVPDLQEVHAALEEVRSQGQYLEKFTGIPVFAAEGLTIRHDTRMCIPLFLSKKDLDIAIGSATDFMSKSKNMPHIEIASLEQVIMMMQDNPCHSRWQEVAFIPSVLSRRALLDDAHSA